MLTERRSRFRRPIIGARTGSRPDPTPSPDSPTPEPGSSPCPTCTYCWAGASGKWCGQLGNSSPDAPKTDFSIKKLTATYYDSSSKELGTSTLNIGSGDEGQAVSGTFNKKADHVYVYWINAAGKLKGPGEVRACTDPCP